MGMGVKRGDVWLVVLDPTVGSEIQKIRPYVVISPEEMHNHLRTVIVAPMTTAGHDAPFRILVRHGGRRGRILLDQIRAIDKIRLTRRTGELSRAKLHETLAVLQEMFAADAGMNSEEK